MSPSEQRLQDIRSHIGQSIARELDTVTLSTKDALWLHSQGLHLLDAKEIIQRDIAASTASAEAGEIPLRRRQACSAGRNGHDL